MLLLAAMLNCVGSAAYWEFVRQYMCLLKATDPFCTENDGRTIEIVISRVSL